MDLSHHLPARFLHTLTRQNTPPAFLSPQGFTPLSFRPPVLRYNYHHVSSPTSTVRSLHSFFPFPFRITSPTCFQDPHVALRIQSTLDLLTTYVYISSSHLQTLSQRVQKDVEVSPTKPHFETNTEFSSRYEGRAPPDLTTFGPREVILRLEEALLRTSHLVTGQPTSSCSTSLSQDRETALSRTCFGLWTPCQQGVSPFCAEPQQIRQANGRQSSTGLFPTWRQQ